MAPYTDGLAESRTRSLEDGIGALRDALASALGRAGHPLPLDGACEAVTQALRQRGEDDMTLVLAGSGASEAGPGSALSEPGPALVQGAGAQPPGSGT